MCCSLSWDALPHNQLASCLSSALSSPVPSSQRRFLASQLPVPHSLSSPCFYRSLVLMLI